MPLRRFLKILLGGILIVLVLAALRVACSFEPSPKPPDKSNHPTNIDDYDIESLQTFLLSLGKSICRFFDEFVTFVDSHDKFIVALSTIFIAIFTVVLGVATVKLWKSTDNLHKAGIDQLAVTQIAADAAKTSADAAVATERARFFIFVHTKEAIIQIKEALTPAQMWDHPTSATDHATDFRAYVPFSFKNYGKTPAIIKEFSFQVTFPEDLPDEPTYFPRDNVLNEYMIEGGGQTERLSCPFDRGITTREGQEILRAQAHIWFWGRILYDDCFGKEHEHRFLWKYNSGSHGFRPCYDYPNYIKNT